MTVKGEPPEMGPAGMVVVRNVRRLRDRRGWSAQELSERARAAGVEVPRSVLANLENGRRRMVTVDEMAALASALKVERGR